MTDNMTSLPSAAPTTANESPKSFVKTNLFSIITGIFSCIGWVVVFGLGMLVNSEPFRLRVSNQLDPWAFFVCLFTYTPTNIFMLCLLAAIGGGCASRLVVSGANKAMAGDAGQTNLTDSQIFQIENPLASMLRGLIVYFSFLAGVFVSGSELLLKPTAAGYTQAAGIISLLAFVVGYDPTTFSSFVKVAGKLKGNA